MSLITNSKIGFTRYAGFSILFNNPGENNYTPMWKGSKLQQIYCSENDTLNLHLYSALKNALQKTGLETNFKKYLFFDLPFYSYHVTVWDGLNEGNIENIAKKYRPALNEFLQKLSCSLEQDNIFIKSAESSNLVNKIRKSLSGLKN